MIEASISRFIRERVNPGAALRDRDGSPLPRELLAEASRLGLFDRSRERVEWGLLVEEVAYVCADPGFSSLIDLHAGLAELLAGTRYAAGHLICGAAAYESRDPFDYLTTAREVAGGWRLDGCKPFVGGALIADSFLVFAKDLASEDIVAFMVERGDEGVCVEPLPTMGLRSMGFGSLRFDDVRLAEERLVVPADGLSAFNRYLCNRRLFTACAVAGHTRALFEACVGALRNRERGGRGVLELPNVQRTVGEMYTAVEASRAFVHTALESARQNEYFDPVGTAAKEFVSEQALKIGMAVLNLMGGEGYMGRHPWERYMRDALGLIGGQGSQELLLIQLGQHVALESIGS